MEEQLSLLSYCTQKVSPEEQIQHYSAEKWEEFTEEWLSTKKKLYVKVQRIGGAGDKGRDVIAYRTSPTNSKYKWDNYQCKHYKHALMPSDIWGELGKLCYYTYCKDFPFPETYYFVAPLGVGPALTELINTPFKFREGLIKNWDQHCKTQITKTREIPLTQHLKNHIENFSFNIFDTISPITLIAEHRKTPYHITRFGAQLPTRKTPPPPPEEIKKTELPYITALLKAYTSDHVAQLSVEDLSSTKYINHFRRARKHFHVAEQLRCFSRDILPENIFEKFKEEIYSSTIDITEEEHTSGFACVKSVEKEARKIPLTGNLLSLCSSVDDKTGTCHHLANEGRLKWIQDDDE